MRRSGREFGGTHNTQLVDMISEVRDAKCELLHVVELIGVLVRRARCAETKACAKNFAFDHAWSPCSTPMALTLAWVFKRTRSQKGMSSNALGGEWVGGWTWVGGG